MVPTATDDVTILSNDTMLISTEAPPVPHMSQMEHPMEISINLGSGLVRQSRTLMASASLKEVVRLSGNKNRATIEPRSL